MKKNLILISLDTVRADVAYGGKFAPINELRKESVTFLNTISSSPLTPVSHASVLTGLQPYNHGIRHLFKEKLNKKVKTISQILGKQGYQTGAIVSCPGMNEWYNFRRGFNYYDDEIPKLADGTDPLQTIDVEKRGTAIKRGGIVTKRAIEWLEKNEKRRPFFLFLHFFDAHWPYQAPEKYGGDNNYEEEVAYSAHYMKLFLDELKKRKLYDQSTIVVFSDHGEDLNGLYPNDKGGKKLGHPEEKGHGCLLYDQTQKVVFIIKDAHLPRGENITQQVRLVDVAPTILDLLKIDRKKIKFDGVSLLPIIKKDEDLKLAAYSETFYPEEQIDVMGKFKNTCNLKSIRIENKYKIIWEVDGNKIEVYDLEKDQWEKNNLSCFVF